MTYWARGARTAAVVQICVFLAAAACGMTVGGPELTEEGGWSFQQGATVSSDGLCLSVSNAVPKGESSAVFRAKGDLTAGGVMRISFDASWRDVVPTEVFSCAGVTVLVEYRTPDGRKPHPKNVNLGFGTRAKTRFELEFPVEKGATDFWAYFGVRQSVGTATFENVVIRLDPPANVRTAGVSGAVAADIVGKSADRIGGEAQANESFLLEMVPPPDWSAPKIPDGRPVAFFRVDSPRRTFDRFAPHPAQLQDRFALSATPGETVDLFFGLYAGKESSVKVEVEEVGAGNCGGSPQLYRAHNWMRAYDRTGAYTVQPEVLFPVERRISLKAGRTALLMAQVAVPEQAAPGTYRYLLTAEGTDGSRREAAVELTVLPFKLRWPDPKHHEFIIHGGPFTENDPPTRLVELYTAMKRRGFEACLVPCQYGPGKLELERKPDGTVGIRRFKKLDDALIAYRAAGLKGTFIIHFSEKLEVAVAQALGIPFKDAAGEQTHMIPEMETPAFRQATTEALRAIVARCGDIRPVIMGYDEPNVAARVPRAKWEIAAIETAGIPSALYCSAEAYRKVPSQVAITSSHPGTPDYEAVSAGTSARGGRMYLYSLEGAYGYGFGGAHGSWSGVMPSRFTLGWAEFLSPLSGGHTAWVFTPGSAVAETDEMAPKGWADLTRYDRTSGRLLTTLQLEGDCLGIADYAYLNTLDELLAECKDDPGARRIAKDFAALKQSVKSDFHPYCLDSADAERPDADGRCRSFLNADADRVRAQVVSWIREILNR